MTDPLGALAFPSVKIPTSSQVGYIYNPGRNQQDVTALIAKMKNEGVTTIIPIWDPLYPILITKEATNQARTSPTAVLFLPARAPITASTIGMVPANSGF